MGRPREATLYTATLANRNKNLLPSNHSTPPLPTMNNLTPSIQSFLDHPVIVATFEAGQRTRQWSDAQDWQMIRREARDLFVALVALAYVAGYYTGKAFYWLNVQATRISYRAAGVSVASDEVKPKAEPVAIVPMMAEPADSLRGMKVAELRKLAREAGQTRAWCRVARKAELLEFLAR